MKEIKNTTKQAQAFISTYNWYLNQFGERENLSTIYKNYSNRKYIANENCLRLKDKLNGFKYCLLGHNSDYFSVAFQFIENDKKYLCYCTHSNDYKIAL